jgi:hypothetical protein
MIALPKVPMRKRSYDPRVGFLLINMMYLKKNLKNLKKYFAVRWRLEPKMLKMLKNKKEENSLNLLNQLFITSIHLLQINGKIY